MLKRCAVHLFVLLVTAGTAHAQIVLIRSWFRKRHCSHVYRQPESHFTLHVDSALLPARNQLGFSGTTGT